VLRAVIGRLSSLKTTFQLGTVSNTLLYTATDLITLTVSAANQTEDKLTHSVSISGDSGIRNAIIKTGGSGYVDDTNASPTGGNGSGAVVAYTTTGGVVTGLDFVSDGAEYLVGDILTLTNPNAGGVTSIGGLIADSQTGETGGSGYSPEGYIYGVATTAETGTGTGLTVDIFVDGNNKITSAVLKDQGQDYEAGDIIEITGANGADAKFAVSTVHGNGATLEVTEVYANSDSDYLAYGIPLEVGGNALYENITLKKGDTVYVSSSEPGVSFVAIASKIYPNIKLDIQNKLGRQNAYISSTAFPQINDNVGLATAEYDGVATLHVSNRNSDKGAAVSLGIASGDISTFNVADYFLFGLRLKPLQDLTIDNIGIASGQTLVTRASQTDVAFAAYTEPTIDGASGVGTDGDVNTSGIITAAQFFGDGSNITGVTAAGFGVSITDNGSNIGVAATINFGTFLEVTPLSAGIATVNVPNLVGTAQTAQVANSLAVGVAVTLATKATNADYASVAGVAGVSSACSGNAETASIASGITSDFDIITNNPITTFDFFIGDGSKLTNVTAVGTGIEIKNNGSTVGTASTVDFGLSLDVSAISNGISTISVQKVPHADICGVASYSDKCGVATFATNAGIASNALNANFAAASSFSTLTGAAETSKSLYTEYQAPFKPLPTTIGNKTANHRYLGIGSDRSVNVQGYESPYLRFEVGQTYRFTNTNNSTYPLRFYYNAAGTGVGYGTTSPVEMTQGVTETGSYTEISVTEETPQLFYYGMGVGSTMGSMGNSIQVFNYEFHKCLKVGEYKNLAGLKTCTHTQMFEGRATAWYMNTNLGVGNSDYVPGDRSHNVSSIEQQSTGVYQVNFADAMNDENYAVMIDGRGTTNFPGGIVRATVYDRTVTGFGVTIYNSIPAVEDLRDINIAVFGGQDGEPTFL
tara:strand:+ start:470 stop:3253 length:2784 start_codon:yes stop_codon:yes gene_type:complete